MTKIRILIFEHLIDGRFFLNIRSYIMAKIFVSRYLLTVIFLY